MQKQLENLLNTKLSYSRNPNYLTGYFKSNHGNQTPIKLFLKNSDEISSISIGNGFSLNKGFDSLESFKSYLSSSSSL